MYAYYFLHEQNWAEAIEWVAAAALTAPTKEDKVRLTYISAQLYGKLGMGYESAISYNKVLKLHPNDYDITFSAQIKRADVGCARNSPRAGSICGRANGYKGQ